MVRRDERVRTGRPTRASGSAGRHRRTPATLPAVAIGIAALGGLRVGARLPGASAPSATAPGASRAALPTSVTPAFVPGPPRPAGSTRDLSRWAPVRRPELAHRAPRATTPVVAGLTTRTPEGTAGIVSVLGRRRDAAGNLWVRVRLPVLPNGTTGWVPRSALGGYGTVDTRLEVDRARLRATLYRAGRPVLRAPVGIGEAQWPTPPGRFYVESRLTRYRSPQYGPIAFGTSARSPTLTDWPAGGVVGIHGTDHPELLPGRVSHGCIRMRNADIRALARLMPVGTPLTIR